MIVTRVPLTSAFHCATVGWGNSRMCVSNGVAGGDSNSMVRSQWQSFPKWNANKASTTCTAICLPMGVISHSALGTSRCFSNRYTVQTGFAVTHSKQTTAVLSNRNKKPSPGGVASELSRAEAGQQLRAIFGARGAPPSLRAGLRARVRAQAESNYVLHPLQVIHRLRWVIVDLREEFR